MGVGRLAVLAIAAVAAVFVALYVRNAQQAEPVTAAQAVETTVVDMPTERVLIAREDIRTGQRVTPADLGWQPWPEGAVSDAFLSESRFPGALEEYANAVARADISRGEPIIGRKLVNPGDAGFMAAVLTPGMRAVSVSITAETGAGGFILPGDRVDVILTYEVEVESGQTIRDEYISRTILENVRVLAIDQLPRSEDDEQSVVGSTATLELSAPDTETIALAEVLGDVTLALRSVVENHDMMLAGANGSRNPGLNRDQGQRRTIYRFGQPVAVTIGGAQ